ncbi:anthranilate synthase component II [Sediminibacillus albus]|uniref:Anthranilate synthase component 2/para-aminobenzoate synthetase component 2 n=1 Tax=Sediminibacillus albus TaxID=407036 RepID=A0A1G8YU46_9BACI|nr:aminodeoxychorismate/anthranilate synthase component II [Sediminibacillus albus]SDK06359.1 anthranilate synthase component 2/para-aminobenzoate synthetase component 2 [Sediminibacillus albus]
MIVIIDNYDSFTYNLVQYFKQLDSAVKVIQCDKGTAETVSQLNPNLIVLSPGPGRPCQSSLSWQVLEQFSNIVPILGVCLGHQTIIEYFGGNIVKAMRPTHGKVSAVMHDKQGIFDGITNPAQVTRYHSLIADEASIPDCLIVTARSEDGAIMGITHRDWPVTGIQFHPESVLTAEGFHMMKNSYQQAIRFYQRPLGGTANDRSIPAI